MLFLQLSLKKAMGRQFSKLILLKHMQFCLTHVDVVSTIIFARIVYIITKTMTSISDKIKVPKRVIFKAAATWAIFAAIFSVQFFFKDKEYITF